ncbi:MAG: hypothetical protein H0V01_06450 [Bacteroidetes bacterium]|nr:hypothetical protein [Bacteroidota bacterium]HET6245172.1 hypothetical protein [Bacteroidia bacterium]
MNKILKYIPLLTGILVPQLFFSQYWIVLTVWIFTGYLLSSNFRNIFISTFILQSVIGTVLFFLWSSNASDFLLEIPVSFNLPGFLMPLFASLFNALNVAFCLLAGATIARIIQRRKFAA